MTLALSKASAWSRGQQASAAARMKASWGGFGFIRCCGLGAGALAVDFFFDAGDGTGGGDGAVAFVEGQFSFVGGDWILVGRHEGGGRGLQGLAAQAGDGVEEAGQFGEAGGSAFAVADLLEGFLAQLIEALGVFPLLLALDVGALAPEVGGFEEQIIQVLELELGIVLALGGGALAPVEAGAEVLEGVEAAFGFARELTDGLQSLGEGGAGSEVEIGAKEAEGLLSFAGLAVPELGRWRGVGLAGGRPLCGWGRRLGAGGRGSRGRGVYGLTF